MNESSISCEELFVGLFRWKRAARYQEQRILVISQSISGYLVITRTIEKEGMDDKCEDLSVGVFT